MNLSTWLILGRDSASLPDCDDIAKWLARNHSPMITCFQVEAELAMGCHRCCCRSSAFPPSCFIFLCNSACYPALYWSERYIPSVFDKDSCSHLIPAHQYLLAVASQRPYTTNLLMILHILDKFTSCQSILCSSGRFWKLISGHCLLSQGKSL